MNSVVNYICNLSATLLTSGATETGSSAAIEEGVYFIRGNFVKVDAQRIVLDKYTILHHIVSVLRLQKLLLQNQIQHFR